MARAVRLAGLSAWEGDSKFQVVKIVLCQPKARFATNARKQLGSDLISDSESIEILQAYSSGSATSKELRKGFVEMSMAHTSSLREISTVFGTKP